MVNLAREVVVDRKQGGGPDQEIPRRLIELLELEGEGGRGRGERPAAKALLVDHQLDLYPPHQLRGDLLELNIDLGLGRSLLTGVAHAAGKEQESN